MALFIVPMTGQLAVDSELISGVLVCKKRKQGRMTAGDIAEKRKPHINPHRP
jgi:hypothetical protein